MLVTGYSKAQKSAEEMSEKIGSEKSSDVICSKNKGL
jgi:hypothetical protein